MRPGDVVAGRFEVERFAGAGGMGQVYRAIDRPSGEVVAIKVLRASPEQAALRFTREAEVLAGLRHPGIVRYIAHGATSQGEPYLAMDWIDGRTLSEHLAGGELSAAEGAALAGRVAEILGAVHCAGLVHRDVKPSNIFLRGGSLEDPILIDFGIVRVSRPARELTETGAMLGTPRYMAPEQARGEHELDGRADVFSLGCVLFRCLTGQVVFDGDNALSILLKLLLEETPRVRQIRPEIPAALDDLVARMLSKSPAARPKDGAVVAAELAALGEIERGAALLLAAAAATAPELTTSERRVVSLVVARPDFTDAETTLSSSAITTRDRALLAAAERYKGKLENLVDGTLLVVLTSAGAATDLAAQAARCALSIRSLLGGAPVAIVSGRSALSGSLPAGEVIARAVELLGRAAGSQEIPVDEVTAGLLSRQFDLVGDRAGLYLRGEQEGFDTTRRLLGKPTACVGRTWELSLLSSAFTQAIETREAVAVLVVAEAGVGKSRLRAELLHGLRAQVEAMEIWIARGDPLGAGSAFSLAARAIRQAAGILEGEPIEARQRKLRARVARHLGADRAAVERVTVFLGELLGTTFPDDDNVQLLAARQDAMLMGDQIRRSWEEFLSAECQAQPVLLVLEDLHWGDVPTIKLIDAALSNLVDQPLLVLALARPEVRELFPRLWAERRVQEVQLRPLTRKASEQLVREALGDAASVETARDLAERAGGNAFYLEELIRAVAEGRGAALPETVLAMVQARLEGLEPEARRVLRAASLFGQSFWGSGVAALLGGVLVDGWLSTLTAQELISPRAGGRFPGEAEFVFRNGLLRESAYGMLTERDRAVGHRLAGEWLERVGEGDAMILAEHFERSDEPSRAARGYCRAAEQALEGNDLDGAIARVERGIACCTDGELLGKLHLIQAEARKWRGENAACRQAALSALSLLPRGGDLWCEAVIAAGVASVRIGAGDTLAALYCDIESLLGGAISVALQTAAAKLSVFMLTSGRPDLGRPLLASLERTVACEPAGSPSQPALEAPLAATWIQWACGVRAFFDDDLAQSLMLQQEVIAALDRAGNARSACGLRVNIADTYNHLGAYEHAEQVLREAMADAHRMGLTWVVTATKHTLGWSLARQGRLEEARRLVTEVVAVHRAHDDRRFEGCARVYLAVILSLAGDHDAAEQEARSATEVLRGVPALRPFARATLARVLLARGRDEEALSQARTATQALSVIESVEEGEALIHLVHAEALEARGDRAAARAVIAGARERLLANAAKITHPALRWSFLTRVPENVRTLELAEAWG